MRQLVELHDQLDAFDALGADIVAVAQKEDDPLELARIDELVGDGITIVCDPDGLTRDFQLFSTRIVDGEGVIRRVIPGTKQARARTDVILAELAEVAGRGDVGVRYEAGVLRRERAPEPSLDDDVLTARWAFSHDRFAPGERTRLWFLPEIAAGWHVYAPDSTLLTPMQVQLELPDGLTLASPLRWPRPIRGHDALLDAEIAWYERDVPLSAFDLDLSPDFDGAEVELTIAVTYQACLDAVCLPPATERFVLRLPVGTPGAHRGQLYGWQGW